MGGMVRIFFIDGQKKVGVALTGICLPTPGGAATSAMISSPGVACGDGANGYLIPDQGNHVIRQVFPNGTIATLAGSPGSAGYSGEWQPALASKLSSPTAIAAVPGGYAIACRGSCRITMLWANSTMSTLAGTGSCALSGDGGMATLAALNPGWGVVAADPAGPGGGLVFADQSNNVIRRVLPSGVIVRVAGTGVAGYSGKYSRRRHGERSPFEQGRCRWMRRRLWPCDKRQDQQLPRHLSGWPWGALSRWCVRLGHEMPGRAPSRRPSHASARKPPTHAPPPSSPPATQTTPITVSAT